MFRKPAIKVLLGIFVTGIGITALIGSQAPNPPTALAARDTPTPTATKTPGDRSTPTSTSPPGGTPTFTPTVPSGPTATPTATPPIPPGVQYYLTGSPQDVTPEPGGGMVLMGGSTDVDAAFVWLIEKSGGGDFVVIRASGSDGYNEYVYDLGPVDSVETLVITSSAAANHPFVLNIVANAEALFIAGGDQWNYVNYWKGTALEDAIHTLRDRNVPIGGTSAGLAIMGEFAFSAENGTVYSNEVLANPYNQYVTLEQDFLALPHLDGVITDSHFKENNRMGRLAGFLARILQDSWAVEAKGIGVSEKTALLVEPDGSATVAGSGGVYFLRTPGLPEVCLPSTPLTFENIDVYRILAGGSFDLVAWTGAGGLAYQVSATNGSLSSTLPRGVY